MSNATRQNQNDQATLAGMRAGKAGLGAIAAASLAPAPQGHITRAIPVGTTPAFFTARELEVLRKACRDSDFEHLWRDYVQPALARAAGPK